MVIDTFSAADLDSLYASRPKKAVFLEELNSSLDDQEWLDFENMSQVHKHWSWYSWNGVL